MWGIGELGDGLQRDGLQRDGLRDDMPWGDGLCMNPMQLVCLHIEPGYSLSVEFVYEMIVYSGRLLDGPYTTANIGPPLLARCWYNTQGVASTAEDMRAPVNTRVAA